MNCTGTISIKLASTPQRVNVQNIDDNPPIDYKISLANQFVVLILPGSSNDKTGSPWFGRIIGGQCVNSYRLDTMGVEHASPITSEPWLHR